MEAGLPLADVFFRGATFAGSYVNFRAPKFTGDVRFNHATFSDSAMGFAGPALSVICQVVPLVTGSIFEQAR